MAAESLRVLTTSDPGWDEALAGTAHDFYHRRAYHQLAEWNGEGEAFLAVYGGDGDSTIAWPYLRRAIEGTGRFDVTCVIGYAGPAFGQGALACAGDVWREISVLWAQQQVVSVFSTFHPLIENDRLAREFPVDRHGPTPAIVSPGRTVSIDLSQSPDARMMAYEKETRYEIRRAYRRGLEVFVDSDLAHVGDLARLNDSTMRRNNAPRRHRFTAEYFERMFELLGDSARLMVATYEGDVVCALALVVDGPFGHAQVTGVSDRHYRLAPLTTIVAAAADVAQSQGARWLHLGAGRGGREDSLFDFKRRIGTVLLAYYTGRWVTDHRAYRNLCGEAHREVLADPPYFPAYRGS